MKRRISAPAVLVLLLISLFFCGTGIIFAQSVFWRAAYPDKYRSAVEQTSQASGLEQSLIFAVIYSESSFNPNVMTSVGARGLMQVTPDTMNWVRYRLGETGKADSSVLFQPETNIHYGSWTLSLLKQEFGNLATALAAYHAGWGNVTRWLQNPAYSKNHRNLDVIPFDDTRVYVKKVLSTASLYRQLYVREDGSVKGFLDYQKDAYQIINHAAGSCLDYLQLLACGIRRSS